MSTSYYALRPPFSRLSVTTDNGANILHFEIEGSPAGELRCGSGWLSPLLLALSDDERIDTMARHLPDSLQLVSEYGDLTTIGELRRGVAP